MTSDTIVALSTPPGTSGLAVVRLSGPGCKAVVRTYLGRTTWTPRILHVAAFRDGTIGGHDDSAGDEAAPLDRLAFHLLPGPASPTGEDVLELFPHGNPLLVETILRALLRADIPGGIRMAEPGEFTRRAFENGRIDLVQAEGVAALVHARSRAALRNARRLLDGELSARLRALRDQLLDLSARLELDVDFATMIDDFDLRHPPASQEKNGISLSFHR